MTEACARPEAITDASRSGNPVPDTTSTASSSPVITIVAASPMNADILDKASIPCVIIQHVGPVPLSSPSDLQSLSERVSQSQLEEAHKCDECVYTSHNKNYLKQHIDLVHNPERPFKCPFCDYAGKRSHSLREHLVVHTNERPYECGHCNASFRKKGHLTNHIKLHSVQKVVKCSLCSSLLFDQIAFEKHLKLVHKTDKIYACELCNFVAGDQNVIEMHIQSHDKVFKCSECVFITADINKLAFHADTHLVSQPPPLVATYGPHHPGAITPVPKLEQAKQSVMVKCTECGFIASDSATMKTHMWVHIETEAKPERKQDVTKVTKAPEKQVKLVQQVQGEINLIEATLPDNAAYKCTECSFIHKEATVFIKHMLTHRLLPDMMQESIQKPPEPKQPPLPPPPPPPPPQQVLPIHPQQQSIEKLEQKFLVTPVTKENTCKNTEKTPFTHDQATGRFRCIICGYTCEYQRTIKAHIWKHSGNQTIDYPMFQNGPLSMYDDVPTPTITPTATFASRTMEESADKVSEKSIPVAAHEEVGITNPAGTFTIQTAVPDSDSSLTAVPNILRSKSENTTTNIKLVKTDTVPMALAGGNSICQMQTVDGKTLALVRQKVPQSSTVTVIETVPKLRKVTQLLTEPIDCCIKEGGVESKPVVHAMSEERLFICDVKAPESSEPTASPGKSPQSPVSQPIPSKEEATSSPGTSSTPKTSHELSKEKPSQGEDIFLQVAKRICFDKETGVAKVQEISVVVETVDAVPSLSDFTGMKSQQNSPRVQEQVPAGEWGEDGSAAEPSPPQAPAETKSASVVTRACTRQSTKAAKEKSEERIKAMQVKQLALLTKEASKEDASVSLTRAKKHSEEAITLLSLLRKESNLKQIADGHGIVTNETGVDSETESENETVSGDSSSKPKTGICSSLLAVIEQLRERSKSESETDESLNARNLQAKRQPRRRSRRESEEEEESNLDHVENMEMVIEDGEPKYRCKLCHYSNTKTLILRLHMRLHKSKKPFECSLCEFIATSSESLQEHMISHCKMRTYPCKLCPSTFNYKSQLRAHMRAHSDKDPLICHMCDFETNDPISYRNHLRFHADQYYHKCDLCSKLFVSKTELRSHKKESCYKDKPEGIDSDESTDSDYEFVDLKESLKCSRCDFTSSSVAAFSNHARIHEDKPLTCELCDFTAVSSRSLKSHMKRHINDQRFVQQPLEQFKCNLCGYVCHHLPSLKSHMWRHASDRNYSYEFTNDVINAAIDYDCHIDGSFTSDPDVLEKMRVKGVMEGRPDDSQGPDRVGPERRQSVCWVVFKCCQCGYETINKAQLNIHMRSHSDIIQQTLEVSQSFTHSVSSSKRLSSGSVSKGDGPPNKLVKTQDHG